jgi:hypothetical protein
MFYILWGLGSVSACWGWALVVDAAWGCPPLILGRGAFLDLLASAVDAAWGFHPQTPGRGLAPWTPIGGEARPQTPPHKSALPFGWGGDWHDTATRYQVRSWWMLDFS